ncbi:hypothetical protein D3C73_753460 [compost metagenome]
MVAVAILELGTVAQDRLAFVGQAPTGGGVNVEHRDTHQLTHRRHAEHAHFTLVTAAPEAVVLVQLAGAHMDFRLRVLDRRRPGFTGEHGSTQGRGARQHRTGHGAAAKEAAPAEARLLFFLSGFFGFFIAHLALLLEGKRTLRRCAHGNHSEAATSTTGISCAVTGADLLRFLRLLISGGHLLSL